MIKYIKDVEVRRKDNNMGDLTENFSEWEFKCKCGCGICMVDTSFLLKLQATRSMSNVRFTITSGCRCLKHNEKEGGTERSDHITTDVIACEGVDIFCTNSHMRYKIINAALVSGFSRIGIHKTFIHLGVSRITPQEVVWVY